MEPQDADVGFWIEDALYAFNPAEKKENARREYFIRVPEQKKLQSCSSWASNYFQTYRPIDVVVAGDKSGIQIHGSMTPVYKNGRAFYFASSYPIERPFSISKPIDPSQRSEICGKLSAFNGVDYDMASLICTQFANEESASKMKWEDILTLMKGCGPLSECDPCTKVGYKIAKSLIKIAALRIFADPEQSIMELPVNSLDAYAAKDGSSRKIGKFGMGFFSILYWLVGHPLRKMIIHSFSKDNEGKYCTYKMTIKEVNGVLAFNLETYPGSEITKTGFRVLIDATGDPFSDENIRNFGKQLDKLKFASGAKIFSNYSLERNITKGRNGEVPWWSIFENATDIVLNKETATSGNDVVCYACPSFILTEDYAIGVPPSVSLGSLFVPSISTKTIQLSEKTMVAYDNQSKYIPPSTVGSNGPARLVILVGGIAVVSIETRESVGDYFVLHMPYNTRLPVSRDDIILTTESAQIFKESISKVFRDLTNVPNNPNVSIFQGLLNKYKEFTPSVENQMIVTQAMNEFFDENKSRLIPSSHQEMYQKINRRFVASESYDTLEIEKWLDANMSPLTNVWYGMKVLLVPETRKFGNVSNGGLINYLFISNTYKALLGEKWVQTITSSYFATKLYPFDSSYGAKEYAKYDEIDVGRYIYSVNKDKKIAKEIVGEKAYKIIKARGPPTAKASDIIEEIDILRYLFAVLAKFESLTVYFEFTNTSVRLLLEKLMECYIFFTRSQFISILGELMKKFSSFKGSSTYGSSKNRLVVEVYPLFITYLLSFEEIGDDDKKRTFYADHIIYGIRATKEDSLTSLRIGTANNPYSLIVTGHLNNNFWKEAWNQSLNIVELTMLMAGTGRAFMHRKFVKPATPGFVAYNLQEIRARRYDAEHLTDTYETWENKFFDNASRTKIHLLKSQKIAKEWIKNINDTESIPEVQKYQPPKGLTTLKLGNMIRSLFEQDIPGPSNVPAFLKEISETKDDKTPLQIIEIAVNEGTVKPFIEATMTELVQNSIDAIREFNPADGTIDIRLSKIAKSSPSVLELSISDTVGMTSDAFIYVGIPFLSTKTPSELVTGEMGSGFFNAYRESTSVLIQSVRDGYSRMSYDVPIRDDRNRVIDITKSMSVKQDKTAKRGTTITVTIPTTSALDEVTKISRVDYTARNILGLALTQGHEIKYNGSDISIPKVLAAKVGYFELYFTDPDTTLKHESYLLTKGVPFSPLAPYFKSILIQRVRDVIDRNFVVNITHGGYTPVQTRTRINIPPEVEADFKKVAIYTTFVTMVREVYKGHRSYALDHMDSNSDANQLVFAIYNIDFFYNTAEEGSFLKYTSFFGQPTIVKIINDCINVMGSELYKDKKEDVDPIINAYSSPYPVINNMVKAIIIRWLSNKNTSHKPPPSEKGKVQQKIKGKIVWVDPDTVPDEPDPEIELLIGAWLKTYYKLASESGVVGYEGVQAENIADKSTTAIRKELKALGLNDRGPRAEIILRLQSNTKGAQKVSKIPSAKAVNSLKNQSKLGWYTPGLNTITINTYNWDDKDRAEIIKVLKEKNVDSVETKLKENKTWDKYFGYRFPAATLPHEMEHFRRRQTHDQGGHDSIYISLFQGDIPQTRTFDQAANTIFQQVLGRGFYEELFKLQLFPSKK